MPQPRGAVRGAGRWHDSAPAGARRAWGRLSSVIVDIQMNSRFLPRRASRALPAVVCTAIAVLALGSAAAADNAAKKGNVLSLGKGQPTGKLLTRDQLRSCLKQQTDLKARNEGAAKTQAQLDADKAEIKLTEDQLRTERETVDTKNAEAVAAFNAKLKQREAMIDAYNAKLPPFNEQAKTLQADADAWKNDCGNRPYDEGDYFAIQRGK